MSTPNHGFSGTSCSNPYNVKKAAISGIRVWLGLGGLLSLVLGILVIAWPIAALGVVSILFGIYFLAIGLIRLFVGIFADGIGAGRRILNIALGLFVLALGIVSFKNQELSIAFLGALIGMVWIVEGIAAITESADSSSRWPGVVFGVIYIFSGLVVLCVPLGSMMALTIWGGSFLIFAGVMQVVRAFTFGRAI
ncbi:DUF308 domain-containing protein [Rhodanobacter sp. MP7CTX1]|uniref:HdeD family acid-resistance protein n=1 Tax=Rhodanobacter sp. MP7CTX1 TaxID=2723084 RepID=UPI00160C36D6|nr:DUF308 domain-containing protein [Rhodanobacter sp. MP7CTX1]MBB6188647.1 uncharacterized membrane protein HdeD (DUF308 family) [Rhodanobacter sp. MP7CTX1]